MTSTELDGSVVLTVGEGRTRIPIRNLWLLYLYASELYEHLDEEERVRAEDQADALLELAARILCTEADLALGRSLNVGYIEHHQDLGAVRGRIDHLGTARGWYLQRGRVLCQFDEISVDTPRNRYIAAALAYAGRRLGRSTIDPGIAAACLSSASRFEHAGVQLAAPDMTTPRREVYGHYDRRDRRAMAAAQFVVEDLLPSHAAGPHAIIASRYTHHSLRQLYEKAIRNFYRVNLPGCSIGSRTLSWPSVAPLEPVFPNMRTDITIDRPDGTRLVIDTKFTSALSADSHHFGPRLKSDHLYQLYAYLRTQVGRGDAAADRAHGMLLYPSTKEAPDLDVTAEMHGHMVRVATVDLNLDPSGIRHRLLEITEPGHGPQYGG